MCVPARCEFHSIYKCIYIPFFSVFFCVFFLLFIFRIVKQLAALLDTSRVRCFDKTWLKAAKGKCPLERRVLPSLLQSRVQRGARNSSFTLYHIYFGVFIMLSVHDSAEHVFTCRTAELCTPLHASRPKLLGKLNFWQIFAKLSIGRRLRILFYARCTTGISVSL